MKKLLLLPTLLLALNLGAATTEATITTNSPKKERSLKQRHDKWVAKNPIKNWIISPACLITYACISAGLAGATKNMLPLAIPIALTTASSIVLIPIKAIYDWKKQNEYQWKKLSQINQLKKEIAKLKQQQ